MPNIKRRFADDDPSSDDDDDEEEEPQYSRMGGKGIRMPGGKGMGKQLRPPPQQDDDDDSDDSSDDDSDDEPPAAGTTTVTHRPGGGKQLRPQGGKQLRAPPQEDDDDDSDDDEELDDDTPVRPVARGGGKALMRMRPPSEDEDSDSDSDEEEDEPQQRVVQRGGGKSLMRMAAPAEEEEDSDDSDDDDEPEANRVVQRGGGKALSRMGPPGRGGGKQLRQPPQQDDADEDDNDDSDDDDDDEPPQRVVQRGGGKSLMRAAAPASNDDDDDDSDDDDDEPPAQRVTAATRGGGKQLRPPPVDDEDEPAAKPSKPQVASRPTGGKQLRTPGGKQLRRIQKDDSSEDESDDDMDVDSEDENQEAKSKNDVEMEDAEKKDKDDEEAPTTKEPPKRRGRPPKKKVEPAPKEVDSDDFDDEDSSSDEEEWDMETFDTNKLVQGEEDQKYLDSLPEIEREAILNDRFEKRKAEHDMKKALRESKRKKQEEASAKNKAPKKRKAATPAKKPAPKKVKPVVHESEDEENEADTAGDEELARQLAGEGKRESVKEKDKKAQRAKALADIRKERQKQNKLESESESDFGDDDDDDSDDEFEDTGKAALKPWQKRAAEQKKSYMEESSDEERDTGDGDEGERMAQTNAVEADLEDYQKVTLPRRRLGRWCNEPFFKEAVKNCFVKLFVGVNEQGKKCYRLCKIVGFETSKTGSYQLPPVKKERPVSTDVMLILKFGNNQKAFPIRLISDAKADEADVKQYVDTTKAQRGHVLFKKQANKLRRKQDDLVNNYTYTLEDIENNLRAKKKKGQTAANLGLEQTRSAIALQGARAALEEAKHRMNTVASDQVAEAREAMKTAERVLEEKLEEEKTLRDKVNSRRAKLAGRSKDRKWADVNRRNITLNQKTDLGSLKPEEKKETTGKPKFDPYARRKVKPKILWEVGQEEEKREEDPKDAGGAATAEDAAADKALDVTPSLVQEQQEKAAALSQSHQFAIDEEVLAQSSLTNGLSGLSSKQSARKRERKGLSLAEYQERKSAGTL